MSSSLPKRTKFPNIPLRWVLIVPFVVQIVGAVGLVEYFSYRSCQQTVEDLANELMTEIGDRVNQHLDTYLGNAQKINQMNLEAVQAGVLDLNNFSTLGKYFYRQKKSFDFAYVNFGSPDGGFIGSGNGENNILEIAEISRSNPNVLRSYAVNQTGDRQKLLGTEANPQTNNRAWYLDAVKTGKPIWSNVYTWADLPDHISLSASTPVYNAQKQLQGVLGIDLELSQISYFLQTLNRHTSGKIFILERSGLMIASSDKDASVSLVNGKAQRQSALTSPNPIIRDLTQGLIQKFGSLKTIPASAFTSSQLLRLPELPHFWVRISPYQDRYGLDWLVVTVVPEAHFMKEIQSNRERTLLLSGLTLVATTLIGVVTARWITHPIQRLSRASQALAQGDWQKPLPEDSAITELKSLSVSFNQMSAQMRQSFETIKNALQDSRAMYQQVVQTQADFVLRSSPDTTITFANEAFCKALGRSLEEVMGLKWSDFINSNDLESIHRQLSTLTPAHPSFITENRNLRTDGQIGWTQWINQGIFDEQGQLIEIQSAGRDITTLKQIEQELRASEERFQKIADSSPGVIYILVQGVDGSMRFEYLNSAVVNIHEISVEAALADANLCLQQLHPDDVASYQQTIIDYLTNFSDYVDNKLPLNNELRFITPSGQVKWLQINCRPEYRDNGELAWYGIVLDISDRKYAEIQLRESQRFIEQITEATPTLLYIYDHIEERNVYANRSVAEVLGYSSTEIQAMGADLFNIISHPDDLPKLYDALQKIRNLKHDEVVELDYRVRDAQGEWHWLLSRYLVFSRTEEGRVWQTLGTAQDISDRKRAEMETAKMRNFLNSIIENIPNMVFVKDAETLRFLRLNTAGEKLLGYSREELLGKNDFDFFPPEEATFFNAKDKEVLAQTSIVDIPQETIQTKHQGIRILHTKKIPILDESGQPQYLLGISEDITEQMESEYRLRQIARHLPGVIYQFRMRADGSFHFPYASEGIQLIYGVTPQEVQEDATPVLSVLHPDDLERVYQSILDSAANLAPWHCEYRVRFDDGRVIWVIGYATPQRILDGSTVWYGYIKDISDHKQAEIALRESEEKFSTIFQTSPDPVWIAHLESGRLIDINTSLCQLLGKTRQEILGHTCIELGIWDNLENLHRLKQQLIQQGIVQNFEIIIRTATEERKTVLISAALTWLNGDDCVISMMKDISDRKEAEILLIAAKEQAEAAEAKLKKTQIKLVRSNQVLLKLINKDPLTKIANRRCFNIHIRQEWKRLYREQQPLSLLLFDVDYFKYYNDLYGHPKGDTCLIKIAQTVRNTLKRPADLVARVGGEEFCVILPNTDLAGASTVAEKIHLAIKTLAIPHQGSKLEDSDIRVVTISLGIRTQIPTPESSIKLLIEEADQALLEAKRLGRNQSVIFSTHIRT